MKRTLLAGVAAIAIAGAGLNGAHASGIPVIDVTAIAKQIEQLVQLKQQYDTLQDQLGQLQELHGSLNKLTDMGDIASLLNDPNIRRVLPPEFADIEKLLTGEGGSASYDRHLEANRYYQPQDANTFYAQELERISKRNAGQMSMGEDMYAAATKRIDGIDQLRKKIGESTDPKTTMDLQARLQAEAAFVQTDMLRMQALNMVQQAQISVEQQRQKEAKQKFIDEGRAATNTSGTNQ